MKEKEGQKHPIINRFLFSSQATQIWQTCPIWVTDGDGESIQLVLARCCRYCCLYLEGQKDPAMIWSSIARITCCYPPSNRVLLSPGQYQICCLVTDVRNLPKFFFQQCSCASQTFNMHFWYCTIAPLHHCLCVCCDCRSTLGVACVTTRCNAGLRVV